MNDPDTKAPEPVLQTNSCQERAGETTFDAETGAKASTGDTEA